MQILSLHNQATVNVRWHNISNTIPLYVEQGSRSIEFLWDSDFFSKPFGEGVADSDSVLLEGLGKGQ